MVSLSKPKLKSKFFLSPLHLRLLSAFPSTRSLPLLQSIVTSLTRISVKILLVCGLWWLWVGSMMVGHWSGCSGWAGGSHSGSWVIFYGGLGFHGCNFLGYHNYNFLGFLFGVNGGGWWWKKGKMWKGWVRFWLHWRVFHLLIWPSFKGLIMHGFCRGCGCQWWGFQFCRGHGWRWGGFGWSFYFGCSGLRFVGIVVVGVIVVGGACGGYGYAMIFVVVVMVAVAQHHQGRQGWWWPLLLCWDFFCFFSYW